MSTSPAGTVVHARNEQLDETVDVERWAELARAVLEAEGVPPGAEMALLFVDEREIAVLNERFLGGSGATDVLSFPIDGRAEDAGEDPAGEPAGGAPTLVGDVVICPLVARRNAPDHAGSPEDEIALLVVHGVLHLLGHDHSDPEEEARMQAAERRHLAESHGPLAADPWQR